VVSLISLRGVRKDYRRGRQTVEVLRDLDLEVPAGDFVALMGPSGSGKTTLLNLVAGLDRPTAGEVEIAGERIDTLGAGGLAHWRARHVGFVFQFYNLMPMLSAQRNVELPLLLTSLSAAQRRRSVDAALELVGMVDRRLHRPVELSGGQQQRVAIARAIVTDPTLIVCDEPTGDLDREGADQILDLLKFLNTDQGKTLLMVTHDAKAAEYANHVVHLDKGKMTTRPRELVA
jgi:putative ABC transport system ATP-binding protein